MSKRTTPQSGGKDAKQSKPADFTPERAAKDPELPPAPTRQSSIAPTPARFASMFKTSPAQPRFAKGSGGTTNGGINSGYNVQGTVIGSGDTATAQGRRVSVTLLVQANKISGQGVDYLCGSSLGFGVPLRKEQLPIEKQSQNGQKVALPRHVDLATDIDSNRLISFGGSAITVNFFQKKDEVIEVPPVGTTVLIKRAEATRGSRGGRGIFLNGSTFELVCDAPDDASVATLEAFHTPSVSNAAAYAAALVCGGYDSASLGDAGREQKKALQESFKKDVGQVAAKMRTLLKATVDSASTADETDGSALAEQKKALAEWIESLEQVASLESCPFEYLVGCVSHPLLSNCAGFMAPVALRGATPKQPFDASMGAIMDNSKPIASTGATVGWKFGGHYVAASGKLLKISLIPWVVADSDKFRSALAENGDFGALCPTGDEPVTGFKIVNEALAAGFNTNYVSRLTLVADEFVPYLDMDVVFPVKPEYCVTGDAAAPELETLWASHFRTYLPNTLARLLPYLSKEEVVKILGSSTIVTPPALAKQAVLEHQVVGATTFSDRGFVPLQEAGVDLNDLESEAAKKDKEVRYAVVYKGCVSDAWSSVDGEFPDALALLEAATARSGVETTKSFVTEHGLIFAYMH